MKDEVCEVFLAIRFEVAPTKTKQKQEWVEIPENPIKVIKRLCKINLDDFWGAYTTLMRGGIYQVGQNQYKLFKCKENKNAKL